MFALVTALDADDEANPWPGGIADTTWWFSLRCVALGGSSAGIYADKPGFHNSVINNQVHWPTNYSVNPNIPVLLAGDRAKARAFDWMFPEAQTKNYVRINVYCARLLAASRARDPRLAGLYEWFGTNDGANIGWNIWRNQSASSDDTHDWHIHFSFITAYLLTWAAVHGVLSVLTGETLDAYLARGGTLIGITPTLPGGHDMFLIKLKGDAHPEVFASEAGEYWHVTSGSAFNGALAAGYRLIEVDTVADLEQLAGVPGAPGGLGRVREQLVALKTELDAVATAVGSTPATVNITPEQIAALGDRIARGVLEPLAEAAEVSANSLHTAAGG